MTTQKKFLCDPLRLESSPWSWQPFAVWSVRRIVRNLKGLSRNVYEIEHRWSISSGLNPISSGIICYPDVINSYYECHLCFFRCTTNGIHTFVFRWYQFLWLLCSVSIYVERRLLLVNFSAADPNLKERFPWVERIHKTSMYIVLKFQQNSSLIHCNSICMFHHLPKNAQYP